MVNWNRVKKRAHLACMIFKVAVIHIDHEWIVSPLQPVSPFLKGELDGKQSTIPDFIVLLRRG